MHETSSYSHDSSPKPTIFAVDDEPDDRELFRRLLTASGLEYSCRFFSTGEELLEALLLVLRGAPPPLACFIDVKMSGMDGLDVLRWIRCQRSLDDVPVVMLSSIDAPHWLSDARISGAQCCLAKFPPPADLRSVILEAQRYCASRSRDIPFAVPGNLLLQGSSTRFTEPSQQVVSS